jgi:hypothetical protein
VETDKVWSHVLNEDYKKYLKEIEDEKNQRLKKKVELQEYLKQ